jgi:predicted methyltransferase
MRKLIVPFPAVAVAAVFLVFLSIGGCVKSKSTIRPPTAPYVDNLDMARGVVEAPDRTPEDRALDAGRRPAELLAFIGVRPGMRVAEIGAGYGYTTELLARAVGPTGVVYGQNNRFIRERFAEKPWSERLAKPVMKPVVRVDREFDDPLPPEATDLDAVVNVLLYHDTVWMRTDRARMNRAIFGALKPGGVYVVVDHSGRAGTGTTETQSLHRIEEKVVRAEIESAGFRLAADADFLRNPSDTRDWNAAPRAAGERRGTSDRFVLKFVRPS